MARQAFYWLKGRWPVHFAGQWFMWTGLYGVRIGKWYFGAIRGYGIRVGVEEGKE